MIMITIDTIIVGLYQTNCYIVRKGRHALLIDPGDKAPKIMQALSDQDILDGIVLTHGHLDHIGAVDAIVKERPCGVYCNAADWPMLKDPALNCSGPRNIRVDSPVKDLRDGNLKIGVFDLMVYETPGHTIGSTSIRIGDNLFTGDTLFHESVGRTDLPTGNENQLRQSLKWIKQLSLDLNVFPGHDRSTTLKHEFTFNSYLR